MASVKKLEFDEIYSNFQPKIHRYLTRLVGAQEAEDLTQEVFAKISRSLADFRGESQISTWIYRIATNAALDKIRTSSFQGRQKNDSITELELEIEDQDVSGEGKKPHLDRQLVREEMNECIRSFIEKLPEDYKTVLILSEHESLKNRDIAAIVGISLDTVKIRLHRAKARLQKELGNHCSFYRDDRNGLACDLKKVSEEINKKD